MKRYFFDEACFQTRKESIVLSIICSLLLLGGQNLNAQVQQIQGNIFEIKTYSTNSKGKFIERATYPTNSMAKCQASATITNGTQDEQEGMLRIEYWPRNRQTGAFEDSGLYAVTGIRIPAGQQRSISTALETPPFGSNPLQNPPEILFKITIRQGNGTTTGIVIGGEQNIEMEHRGTNN
jgi:hypothetical protein